ncbi:hypothetical protein TKY113292_05270 [Streptococcus pneumoniae]|nr:hypothetical protein TKY113292_05270 [Streptococcus pneumoniae]VND08733.1 bacteriocin BlpM [Streptococcus pneumoniae]VPW82078.1 bacteriocin BlpM [Streptococcus pneumoniae]VQK63142.1 bacteriocin BlpM [Streptococcus pneumoniae]
MDTKIMEQFHEMDITMLSSIEGGKNNWQTNVLEGGGAAFGGWGLGTRDSYLCCEWCWSTIYGSMWIHRS